MTTFIIAISFGQNTEYWNSSLVNDDKTTQHIDSAEGFDSEDDAQYTIDNFVKPFAEKKDWNVSFSIEELN
jgi:hypothetical protein